MKITSAPEAAAAWRAGDREGCRDWCQEAGWSRDIKPGFPRSSVAREAASRVAQVALELRRTPGSAMKADVAQQAFLRFLADPSGSGGAS